MSCVFVNAQVRLDRTIRGVDEGDAAVADSLGG